MDQLIVYRSTPWCLYTNYLQYISSNTSTCFGRTYSTSSRDISYGYNNWYLLYPYGCTSWWWAIDTPETCRGVLRNILKINCASSWSFFKRIYRDSRSTKLKKKNFVSSVSVRLFCFIEPICSKIPLRLPRCAQTVQRFSVSPCTYKMPAAKGNDFHIRRT